MAERDGVSLNQFLVSAIAARIGAEDFYNRLADKIERRLANMEQKIVSLSVNAAQTGPTINKPVYSKYPTANNKFVERPNA
jgi:hypothetical protein